MQSAPAVTCTATHCFIVHQPMGRDGLRGKRLGEEVENIEPRRGLKRAQLHARENGDAFGTFFPRGGGRCSRPPFVTGQWQHAARDHDDDGTKGERGALQQ